MVLIMSLYVCAPAMAEDDHDHGTHEGDFAVGVIGNKLAFDYEGSYHVLAPPVSGVMALAYNGWAINDPGFDAIDSSAHGLDPVNSGALLNLEILTVDGVEVHTPQGAGVGVIEETIPLDYAKKTGDLAFLGTGTGMHTHPWWFLDSDVLGESFSGEVELEWRLVDARLSGGHDPSDPVTMHITNVPEPGAIVLLGLGGMVLFARRRTR
jgi:hypothetical protein